MGLLSSVFSIDPNAGGGTGLLGRVGQSLSDNSGMLLGLAAGGPEGAMMGKQADMRAKALRQDEEEKKRLLAQAEQLAKATGHPEIAGDPTLARQFWLQQHTPKEVPLEKQIWNSLSPEQKQQYVQNNYLKSKGEPTVAEQIRQRQMIAPQIGLTPDHPAYQSWVATGKMPREDQAPLTATDKKAILEADEGVAAAQNAIDALNKAKQLSPQAYEGPTAGPRSNITSLWGNEAGVATQELDNLVGTNALQQMKSIFGANPTEGERAILLELQGASSKPDAVRQKIYDRAIEMAQRRLAFNKQRADSMRGGTFYGAQGRGQQQSAPQASQDAITVDGYTIRQR